MTADGFIAFARSLPEPMALADERGRVLASNASARDFVVPLRYGISICDLPPTRPASANGWPLPGHPRPARTTVPIRARRRPLVDVRLEATPRRRRRGQEPAGCCCACARASRARTNRRCRPPRHATASCSRTPSTASAAAASTARSSKATRRSRRCSGTPRPDRWSGSARPDVYDEPVAFLTLVDRIRHAGRVPQHRRQLDAQERRFDGGAPVGPLRGRRQPRWRDRADGRGRDRTADARGAARAHHQDGVDRPPRRRHRARLQQPAHGDPRLRRPDAGLARASGSDRARTTLREIRRAAERASRPDAPAPRLQPQAGPAAARPRPQRAWSRSATRCCAG